MIDNVRPTSRRQPIVSLSSLSTADSHIQRTHPALNTLLMVADGRVLHSRVYNPRTGLDTPQPQKSVTKSVMSALIGIAIERGHITGVDQPLKALLKTRFSKEDSNATGNTTLHQLLSMTCGLLWRDGRLGNEPMVPRMMNQDDWIDFVLKLPVNTAMVGRFQYNSAVSHLLSAVIHATTGLHADRFADDALFGPLGITDYTWERDRQGYPIGGWGLSLCPRDMVKFGELYLHGGRAHGKQIFADEWVARSVTPHTEGYGYQWWLRTINNIPMWCACGLGGQSICCIPQFNSLIVTTSQLAGRRKPLWPLFEKYWLPALQQHVGQGGQ